VQLGDTLRRQHCGLSEPTVVYVRGQIIRHVAGGRDDETLRDASARQRLVERDRSTEPGAVTCREAIATRVLLGSERVLHAQRREYVRREIRLERLARDLLHDQSEDLVVAVAVLIRRADGGGQRNVTQVAHALLERVRRGGGIGERRAASGRRETARLIEQLTHGDARRRVGVGYAKPWQVALHRRIELHSTRFYQLHHG